MRNKFWRTKYLTGSRIQFRYLTLLLASMVIPVVLVGGCLYFLILTIMAEQIGIPEYVARGLYPVIKEINFILLISVPLVFLVLIIWGVVLSHRFAGPMERVEKELKRILDQGDYSKKIKLRKKDDMCPTASLINELLERLEGKGKR